MLGIGSTTSAINFIVTILNMRAPGMTLMRMPVFAWMMLVVAFLTVFAMPVITAALIMVFFDRNFGTTFFLASKGGDPLLYQHLFWLFGHPEVYILILPGMGIVSEMLPVFSRKPLFGYSVVVFSGIAIGFLGWGVWAHHMFATGLGPVAISAFGLATMLIAIPTGVKIFNWLGTVSAALRLTTAMLFSLGFIVMFTIGGLSGVMHSIVPADTQQTDTYFVVAHFHYVLFGGLVFGDLLRLLLLVAEDVRADARRAPRQDELLAHAHRVQPHVLPDAHPRPHRHAAPHLPLPEGMGWDSLNHARDDRCVRHRARGARLPRERHRSSPRRRSQATTRGTGARSSGRSRRRRPSTTSPRSPRSRPVTTGGTASTPRTTKVDWCGCRPAAPTTSTAVGDDTTAGSTVATRDTASDDGDGHGIHMPSPSYYPLVVALGLPSSATPRVHEPVGRDPRRARLLFGIYAWAIEPGRRASAWRRSSRPPSDHRAPSGAPRAARGHAADHDDHGTPTRHTGLANPKLAMWLFLSSDCLFFGAFISTYLLYRDRAGRRARPRRSLRHPVHVGHVVHPADEQSHDGAGARRDPAGDHRRFRVWLLATALFGATFIAGQIFEFTEFTREGLNLDTNLFGSSFFVLTGFHGAHVTVGILWLLSLWGLVDAGPAAAGRAETGRDRRPLLALRRRGLDRDLHRHLPDPEVEAR